MSVSVCTSMLDKQGYIQARTHTHKRCNIYCSCTATIICERASMLRLRSLAVLLKLTLYGIEEIKYTLNHACLRILNNGAFTCQSFNFDLSVSPARFLIFLDNKNHQHSNFTLIDSLCLCFYETNSRRRPSTAASCSSQRPCHFLLRRTLTDFSQTASHKLQTLPTPFCQVPPYYD
jgi:hypothetical protein